MSPISSDQTNGKFRQIWSDIKQQQFFSPQFKKRCDAEFTQITGHMNIAYPT
jgi:hypothetical protein